MKKRPELKPASNFLQTANLYLLVSGFILNSSFSVRAAPPEIVHPPQGQTVILYQQAAFGVIATGTAPLSYQWRKDGTPIAGATNDQMVIAQSQFSDVGRYSVLVSNAEATATSAEAVLTVNPPQAGDVDFSFLGGANNRISSVVSQSDGKVLIGGWFTAVDGVPRKGVARLQPDGVLDSGFDVEISGGWFGGWSEVSTIALQPEGKVLIGGSFTAANGVPVSGIARLNSDGTLDADFQPAASDLPGVTSIVVQSNRMALIARIGSDSLSWDVFTSVERLNPDGAADTAFHNWNSWSPLNFEVYVTSLVLQNDGKVLVSGANIGPFRLNTDGTGDSGFVNEAPGLPSCGGEAPSSVVAVQEDGKIIMGISCGDCNNRSYSLFRLNGNGTLDTAFHAAVSGECGTYVSAIAMQRDGKILIGGMFTTVNGERRGGIARLNGDGTLDRSFQNGLAGTGRELWMGVRSIAFQQDGKVLIAGEFTEVNGMPVGRIARLWGSADIPPRIKSFNRNGAGVTLSWDALPNRLYRVQYKDDLAATWSDLAGNVSGSPTGTASKTDTTVGNVSQRFYRVELLP